MNYSFAYPLCNIWPASPRLRTRKLHDLGPLVSLLANELGEIGGRGCVCLITQVGDPHFQSGIGKTRVDLPVQQFNQFRGRVPWRTNPMPRTRLVPWQEFSNRRNVGSSSERLVVVTASARNRPALMCSIELTI